MPHPRKNPGECHIVAGRSRTTPTRSCSTVGVLSEIEVGRIGRERSHSCGSRTARNHACGATNPATPHRGDNRNHRYQNRSRSLCPTIRGCGKIRVNVTSLRVIRERPLRRSHSTIGEPADFDHLAMGPGRCPMLTRAEKSGEREIAALESKATIGGVPSAQFRPAESPS